MGWIQGRGAGGEGNVGNMIRSYNTHIIFHKSGRVHEERRKRVEEKKIGIEAATHHHPSPIQHGTELEIKERYVSTLENMQPTKC